MGKTKDKAWLVTMKPPKGGTPKLATRNSGEKRTALRNFYLHAPTRAEAQSRAEGQERLAAEQNEVDAWVVDSVTAA